MECKGRMLSTGTPSTHCFNRNIVECKVSQAWSPESDTPVLIETLWNVKSNCPSMAEFIISVLIETLWNVKLFARISSMEVVVCFNRNIVECKDNYHEF